MCFVALFYRVVPDYPVILAGNRDERLDRPSQPPHAITEHLFGGRDLQAGGTWLAINRAGVLAAVANIGYTPRRSAVRSRGLLCMDVLQSSSAQEAAQRLRDEVRLNPYNDFNFLAADPRRAFVATHYGERLVFQALGDGVHVIGNSVPDDLGDAKGCRGRILLSHRPRNLEDALDLGKRVCIDHGDGDGAGAICVHHSQRGTVSSSIVALHESLPSLHRYLHAEGPPCQNAYEELRVFAGRARKA